MFSNGILPSWSRLLTTDVKVASDCLKVVKDYWDLNRKKKRKKQISLETTWQPSLKPIYTQSTVRGESPPLEFYFGPTWNRGCTKMMLRTLTHGRAHASAHKVAWNVGNKLWMSRRRPPPHTRAAALREGGRGAERQKRRRNTHSGWRWGGAGICDSHTYKIQENTPCVQI